jgi:DNA-directed RNA polymerase subunit K/omega
MTKVSVEDLLKDRSNIYEAVAIIAKRSRQINDMQKRQIDSERENLPVVDIRDSEDFEDVEIDREALNRDYIKMPKPTRLALEEMRENKINWRYKEEEI